MAMQTIVHHFSVDEDIVLSVVFKTEGGAAIDMRGRDYRIKLTNLRTREVVATLDTGNGSLNIGGAGFNVIEGRIAQETSGPQGPHTQFGADLHFYDDGDDIDTRLVPMVVNLGPPGSVGVKGYRGVVAVTMDPDTLVVGNPVTIIPSSLPGPAPWRAPTSWANATAYSAIAPADAVSVDGSTYVCIVSHTSSNFTTDLAANRWQLIAGKGATGNTGPQGNPGSTGGDAIGVNARIKARRNILRASSPDIPAVLDLDFARRSLILCSDDASAPQDALMNLYEWAGTSFDEPLVEQFVQAIGVFPVGSLVELSTGEVAVVLAHNRVRRLEPRVMVLTGADKSATAAPFERDLLARPKDHERGPVRIVRGLADGAYGLRPGEHLAARFACADETAR